MEIQEFYSEVRSLISKELFENLEDLGIAKPKYFNWMSDVFYPRNVKSHPESNALIWRYGKKERSYTFEEINNESNQFLNFLRNRGVKKSSCVYTQLPLDPANWICSLAAIKGGLILIPAPTSLTKDDIGFRFKTVFPEVIVSDSKNAPQIEAAEKLLNKDVKVKIIIDEQREGWQHINGIYKEEKIAETTRTLADDPLFYFFTSGTTGLPKIVIHTHFTYPFGHLSTSSWIGMRHGDIHYNISAPGWAKFAWSNFFAPWNMGATIFANQVDKFDAKDQLETIEKYGVTTFCAPPTVLRMMIQEDLSQYNFKLRQCVAAGEPLNAEIIEKWKTGTGTIIRDGYGQTETTCLAANLPGVKVKYGSMGKPTFLYDIVIADDEGKEQPNLEEGNICLKTSDEKANGIFIGYLGEPERKSEVFKHGLYYTGDKAYKDEDGFIWFVGRDDDVIKASDFRIGPFEVESKLLEHKAVIEAAVVASPHDIRGYAVKAFIVVSGGIPATKDLAEELFNFCEEQLADYKIPRVIEFVETLPKTISGKIRRIELRAKEAEIKNRKQVVKSEFFHQKYL